MHIRKSEKGRIRKSLWSLLSFRGTLQRRPVPQQLPQEIQKYDIVLLIWRLHSSATLSVQSSITPSGSEAAR
jgi:hypothetical protein